MLINTLLLPRAKAGIGQYEALNPKVSHQLQQLQQLQRRSWPLVQKFKGRKLNWSLVSLKNNIASTLHMLFSKPSKKSCGDVKMFEVFW